MVERSVAQEPHKSAYEGVLRDAAYYAVADTIRARAIKAQHAYPKVRHTAFKRLASGSDPDGFSLSALLRYAEALSCRPAVHRALCAAGA